MEDARGLCPGAGGVRGASGRVLGASWSRPGVRRASWGRPADASEGRLQNLKNAVGARGRAPPRLARRKTQCKQGAQLVRPRGKEGAAACAVPGRGGGNAGRGWFGRDLAGRALHTGGRVSSVTSSSRFKTRSGAGIGRPARVAVRAAFTWPGRGACGGPRRVLRRPPAAAAAAAARRARANSSRAWTPRGASSALRRRAR